MKGEPALIGEKVIDFNWAGWIVDDLIAVDWAGQSSCNYRAMNGHLLHRAVTLLGGKLHVSSIESILLNVAFILKTFFFLILKTRVTKMQSDRPCDKE